MAEPLAVLMVAAVIAALMAGDVDFIAPVPPTDLARIKADPCCTLVTKPSTRVMTCFMS